MEDEDDIFLLLFLNNAAQSSAVHTSLLVSQTLALSTFKPTDSDEESSSDEEGPGRGLTSNINGKAPYARRPTNAVYDNIRNVDADTVFFEKTVHFSREDFDALHLLCKPELEKTMDVRRRHSNDTDFRVPRRRRLDTEELLFIFLDIYGGPCECGIGLERIAHRYGVSVGTVSNYFRHVLFSLYNTLDSIHPRLIRWPSTSEREDIEDLILGFPSCVFFVDGNKNKRWRPKDQGDQEVAYDGYKKAHDFSIVVFCDLFGRFIRLEVSENGAMSDRNMFTNTDVFQNAQTYLSFGQHGMADMGYAGSGPLVVPFKRNESTEWIWRGEHNDLIRRQRMVNEWGIGYINNRFRIFLGRWPFSPDLFPIAFQTASMLCNWTFDRRGYALQTRARYEEKLRKYEENSDNSG